MKNSYSINKYKEFEVFLESPELLIEKFKLLNFSINNSIKKDLHDEISSKKKIIKKFSTIYSNYFDENKSVINNFNELHAFLLKPIVTYFSYELYFGIVDQCNNKEEAKNLSNAILIEFYYKLINISFKVFYNDLLNFKLIKRISKEKIKNYINQKNYILNLINRYPELFILIDKEIIETIKYHCQLLVNLKNDREAICKTFKVNFNDIKNIAITGDKHGLGKTVSIIEFVNGTKVVYKPGYFDSDVFFESLIKSFNFYSKEKLYHPKTLIRNGYKWMEFICHLPCKDEEEFSVFYYKIGLFQSIFYFLNAHDIHYENLIAFGNNPVMVDVECLFDVSVIKQINNDLLFNSVYKNLLLPTKIAAGKHKIWMGGINNKDNQTAFMPYEFIDKNNNFNSILSNYDAPANNIPFVKGNLLANISDYKNEIIKGFTEGFLILIHNRKILKKTIDKSMFSRHLARPSFTYRHLLNESYHPLFFKSPIDRKLFFDWLWLKAKTNFKFNEIIKHEQDQLYDDLIPCFMFKINERHLYDLAGKILIRNYFARSGYNLLIDKIDNLSTKDLTSQIKIIEKSFDFFKASYTNKNIP